MKQEWRLNRLGSLAENVASKLHHNFTEYFTFDVHQTRAGLPLAWPRSQAEAAQSAAFMVHIHLSVVGPKVQGLRQRSPRACDKS